MNDTVAPNSTKTTDVLLAGCGDINTELGLRLSAQGHHIVGVRRSPEQRDLPFPVIQRDLADPRTEALPAADAVVVALTAEGSDADAYQRAYRDTLRGLASLLPVTPRRLVLISSTGVLGSHDGSVVTETTPLEPDRQTAEVLLAAEEDAVALFDDVVILRPAGIYGPGRGQTVNRVLDGKPADHGRVTNRIHRDDLVTAMETVLAAESPPSLMHAVDKNPAPLGEVLAFLAQRLGVRVPPDSGDGTPSGKTIDAARLHALLGAEGLRFPTFREGYAALLADDAGFYGPISRS